MRIEISNTIKIRGAPHEIKDPLVKYLTVENPEYLQAAAKGRSTRGIPRFINNYDYIYNGIAIPRGCRKMLLELIDTYRVTNVQIEDKRTIFERMEIPSSTIKYRPYQIEPMVKLASNEEGLLVAPPGSGKTVMGLSLVPIVGQPCLWLTHTDRLAKQVRDRVNIFLPTLKGDAVGNIGGGKWKVGKVFTVGMVQTIVRRLSLLESIKNHFGIVILDEAHHCPASTFLEVVTRLNPFFLYALTATPYRRDGLEVIMFQAIGDAAAAISTKEVAKHGGIVIPIVKYRAIRSKTIEDNNTNRLIREHIINNDDRNKIIVSDVVREARIGNFCIVISDRRAHCETLYNLISIGWPKTGIATGKYTKKEVDEQVEKFYNNEITVLVTTFDLLGEGFDVDFLNRAFITTPFRAEGKVEQLVGRIQRSAEGKIDAIVYDYVDVDIGVFRDQFHNRYNFSRSRAYKRLGVKVIEPASG